MSILLIGATGRTGRSIAGKLPASLGPVRALIRDPAKGEGLARFGIEPVIADLDDDFSSALAGIATVIFAAGSAETEGEDSERKIDRDAVIRAVDASRENGVRLFVVVSALLATQPERAPGPLRHYARMKREADDHVIASGLDYLVLRPGSLTTNAGVGKIGIVTDYAVPHDPLAREDVAAVLVEALGRGMTNRIIDFSGGATPIPDALAALASARGSTSRT
jgi:uncharacterized protein YbjT (DUF2867 family)